MDFVAGRWWNILLIQFLLTSRISTQSCYAPSKKSTIGDRLRCSGFVDLLRCDNISDIRDFIIFSNNKVTSIDSWSFNKSFETVTEIWLDNNKIGSIDAGAFKNLSSLKRLDLSHNKIEFLHPDLFSSNTELETVHLNGNQIRTLNLSLIQELPNLKEFTLSNNSLNVCDCGTIQTLNYLEKKQIATLFLQNCQQQVALEACGSTLIITESNITNMAATFLSLVVILLVMLLLGIALGFAVLALFRKITRKQNSSAAKLNDCLSTNDKQTVSPGEDKYGYLIPIGIKNQELDKYGYLIPTKPEKPAKYLEVFGSLRELNTPLLISTSANDMSQYEIPNVQEISVSNEQITTQTSQIQYEDDHVYEEVQDGFYKRNLQMNLRQPYSRVKTHT